MDPWPLSIQGMSVTSLSQPIVMCLTPTQNSLAALLFGPTFSGGSVLGHQFGLLAVFNAVPTQSVLFQIRSDLVGMARPCPLHSPP